MEYKTKDYIIHYGKECYPDGCNLLFSIEFLNFKYKDGLNQQTGWYNDNHEFGDEEKTRVASIKMAEWYLENPWRIEMINSGLDNPLYFDYRNELSNLYDILTNTK